MIATLVKDNLEGFNGHAALYKLEPPLSHQGWNDEMTEHEYVVVSAADVMFSGPETYIFPANEDGKVTDWGELEGSYRGGFDHAHALSGAGYGIA